jgi:mono/diheme cytochrome c family protein
MLTSSENPQGSASDGESLFIGRTHFLNRGPACISCHSIAGLPFPNGGTLGPDLTQTYAKLGPAGTQAAMQTLYFPTMIPVYRDHQLAPQEQADMVAYFRATAAEAKPQAQWTTQMLILAAFVLGIIFIALTAFFWRKRVLSVRAALVARATGQGVRS